MTRRTSLLAVIAGLATLGGCPVDTTDTSNVPLPSGDPSQATQTSLSINSTASFLQFNALDLLSPKFPSTADLNAVLANATATSIVWSIETDDVVRLGFVVDSNNDGVPEFATTTTGSSATVGAMSAPDIDAPHTVVATATLDDGSTLTSRITVVVAPDPIIEGDASVLIASPFASPAVGVDSSNQVTLNAGVAGEVGVPSFNWSPLDPSRLAPGITLPSDLTTPTITLDVADGVAGVFPFRVEVTDSIGNVTTAIVNVYLGIVDLTLDVKATRVQLNPASTISIQTIRAGGSSDLDTSTDNTFRYTWQILDESNTDVTGAATINPGSGSTLDANVLNWTISGLSAGSYRCIATVTDRVGDRTTSSATVLLTENLGLALSPNANRVGINTAFTLRTTRTGGQGPFTYTFSAIDSTGAAATTTFTPPSGTTSSLVSNDWVVGGFAATGNYRMFATVTDGAGNTFTASTAIAVGDVLTVDARVLSGIVAPSNNTTMLFHVNGGVGPYTYTFSNVTAATGTPAFSVASGTTVGGDLSMTWTAPAAAAGVEGTYRTDVTVVDSIGARAQDSVQIEVATGGAAYAVDVQAIQTVGAVSHAYTPLLHTIRNGGTGAFTNTWIVFNSSGANVTGSFTITAVGSEQDEEIDWNVTVGAVADDTYRFLLTVTDANLNDAIGSSSIVLRDYITADLQLRVAVAAQGMPVPIRSIATGGVNTYSHVITATDSQEDLTGVFNDGGNPRILNAVAAAVSDVFLPAVNASGTYRIQTVITDNLGNSAQASAHLFVTSDSTIVRREPIINPPASQHVDLSGEVGFWEAGEDLNQASPYSFNPDVGAITNARNVTARFFDAAGNDLTVTQLVIDGTNQRGNVIQETINNPVTDGSTLEFDVPFATITNVTVTMSNQAAGDTLELGIGQRFGINGQLPLTNDADALQAIQLVAVGTTFTTSGANGQTATFIDPDTLTVHATEQQYIMFPGGSAPDGTRDYFIQYEPN